MSGSAALTSFVEKVVDLKFYIQVFCRRKTGLYQQPVMVSVTGSSVIMTLLMVQVSL